MLELITALNKSVKNDSSRDYIGASAWESCQRKIWFKYRNVIDEELSAETKRTFKLGHLIESMMIDELELAGYKTEDKQRKIINREGRTIGHIDGVIWINNEPCIIDVKSAKDEKFKAYQKTGTPEKYYTQMQLYMFHTKIKKAILLYVNKNTSEIAASLIEFNEAYAREADRTIEDVLNSEAIPSASETWQCKFCTYQVLCQSGSLVNQNCGTCANSDSNRRCKLGDKLCDEYTIHPQIMELNGFKIISVDVDKKAVTYQGMGEPFIIAPAKYNVEGAWDYNEFTRLSKECG